MYMHVHVCTVLHVCAYMVRVYIHVAVSEIVQYIVGGVSSTHFTMLQQIN